MKNILIISLMSASLLTAGHAADSAGAPTAPIGKPAAAVPSSAKYSLEEKFRLALIEEETSRHLDSVVQAYKEVIAVLDEQRKMAVTAIFHLGECYRKQEKSSDAVAQYDRILRDFSEQKSLCDLARQRLAELVPGRGGSEMSPVAPQPVQKPYDPEQVKMIREEIKLVERQLDVIRVQLQHGRAPTSDLYKPQQDILALKRLLPENASPEIQKSLIQQQMQITEKNMAELRRKIEVGAAPPLDSVPLERELLGLKRELIAVSSDKSPSGNTAEKDTLSLEKAGEIQKINAILKDGPNKANARDDRGKTRKEGNTPGDGKDSRGD